MVYELFSDFKIIDIVGKLPARNFMKISKVEKKLDTISLRATRRHFVRCFEGYMILTLIFDPLSPDWGNKTKF